MKRVLPILALVVAGACADRGDEPPRTGTNDSTAVGAADAPSPSRGGPGLEAAPADPPAGPADSAGGGGAQPAADGDVDPSAGDPGGGSAASDADPTDGPPGADPYAVLERASAAYESLRSIRADFRQEARNPLLRRIVRSRGTLYQRQPDLFLMRFEEPAGDVIVSDGDHLWVYYPSVDSAQVLRMPAARGAGATDLRSQFIGNPAERFRASLRGEEAVDGRPADVLVLEPRGDGEPYRSLVAWIDRADGLARRFEITEANGLVRRFDLSGLRRNPDLSESLFRFEVPAGVRVVDRG